LSNRTAAFLFVPFIGLGILYNRHRQKRILLFYRTERVGAL